MLRMIFEELWKQLNGNNSIYFIAEEIIETEIFRNISVFFYKKGVLLIIIS